MANSQISTFSAAKTSKGKRKYRSTSKSWPTSWDTIQAPDTEAEADALVQKCRKRLPIMVAYISTLVNAGKMKAAKALQRQLLVSGSALVAALDQGIRRKGHSYPASAILAAAPTLDMWNFSGDCPVLRVLSKEGQANFRPVFSYGPVEYARQYLGHVAARPFAQLSPRQFLYNGGVPAIFNWLEDNISAAKVVIITDVPNCFLSLSRERVEADRLLPKPVLRSLLFEPMSQAKLPTDLHIDSGNSGAVDASSWYQLYHKSLVSGCGVQKGRAIPPGSAISSLVAEVRLRALLDTAEASADGVLAATIADNIIILAPSQIAAKACLSALHSAALSEFGEDVAHELRTRTESHAPSQFFSFLKRNVKRRAGKLVCRLPEGRIHFRLAMLAVNIHEKVGVDKIAARLNGWAKAHDYDPAVQKEAKKFAAQFEIPFKTASP